MGAAVRVIRRETDEEVRQNLSPSQRVLFDRVRGMIKGNDHMSRTEAFLQYAEEHPDEEAEAATELGEFRLKQHLRPMLDFYETPAWAIRVLDQVIAPPAGTRILDPGCGTGAIIRELGAMWPETIRLGLEKEDGRYAQAAETANAPIIQGDFLLHCDRYDLIVSNPPYSYALEFVDHALTLAPAVVMLLRLPWLASQQRADWHRDHPARVCILPRRPSFTQDRKTDATEYAWFCWGLGGEHTWQILRTPKAKRGRRAAESEAPCPF
jgi:SAM-dependent methyltransferase